MSVFSLNRTETSGDVLGDVLMDDTAYFASAHVRDFVVVCVYIMTHKESPVSRETESVSSWSIKAYCDEV